MGQYLANKITSILPISSATMDEVLIARSPHFSDPDGGVLGYTYQQDNIVNQVFELRSPSSSRCAWPTERTVVFDLGLKWPSLITYDLMYDFSAAFRTAAITIYQAMVPYYYTRTAVRLWLPATILLFAAPPLFILNTNTVSYLAPKHSFCKAHRLTSYRTIPFCTTLTIMLPPSVWRSPLVVTFFVFATIFFTAESVGGFFGRWLGSTART